MGYKLSNSGNNETYDPAAESDDISRLNIEANEHVMGWSQYETATGDGGFLDSFNALKQQIDFVYRRYKEQRANLDTRIKDLAQSRNKRLKTVILMIAAPIVCCLLLELFTRLGLIMPVFGLFYIIMLIVTPICAVVCIFIFLPAALRELINAIWQYKVLNSDESSKEYRKKKQIISFEDERNFLEDIIKKYDDFYREVDQYELDKKDGWLQLYDTDEMTAEQQEIIDRMRSMTIYKEYSASVVETRKNASVLWLIIGVPIMIIVIGVLFL